MSGIAEVLLNMGFAVSGSDLKAGPVTEKLVRLGGRISSGHLAENVHGADVVVVSSAVKADNVEVTEAHRLAIPVIPRAEMLAELMRMKYGVCVAGSHGKTTTTSMVAHLLAESGFDPTIVIGGRLGSLGGSARLGSGDLMVAEADESDGSFLHLHPTIAVVTNIDAEHLDHYGSLEALRDAFADFLNKVPFYGLGVVCLDNPEIQGLMPRLTKKLLTYGASAQADLTASAIEMNGFETRYEASMKGARLGEVRLRVPGRHSVHNSLAALAVALEFDVAFEDAAARLATFHGADRRFQLKGTLPGDILVVDDYGHHPTEIRATLRAAKEGWKRRIVAVFQPHRFTRVRALAEEFTRSFYEADVVIVTPIYPAGEDPIDGISSALLYEGIRSHGHRDVTLVADLDEAEEAVRKAMRPGDIVVTLGAGDVGRICERVLLPRGGERKKRTVRGRGRDN
ncbi:MAG: UDP-N-acetylmuramate--L-alanine ligase [Acidobacteria bacterium]|nr:UDP-N-acetylmuramate--L-alanine ligase [Acidobacteriota bacterium]